MMRIRTMHANDWDTVRRIYAEGIATGLATFETDVPSYATWDAKHHQGGRLVALMDDVIVGWAAMMPTSSRYVYRGVAEESIYISASARGQGVGTALMHALIQASEAMGIWTLQAGIFRTNTASIRLHEKCGYRVIGYRERIGKLGDTWHDTVIMERRSSVVGVD